MTAILLNAPATEPLSLAETKAFLRVEHSDEDALISDLIAAARAQVEIRTRLRLMTQTWRVFASAWPRDGRLIIGFGPLRDILAARLRDRDDTETSIDAESLAVDATALRPTIVFTPGSLSNPEPSQTIEIDVEAGYGAAGDVPKPLRQAMRLLIAHGYERRTIVSEKPGRLPEGFDALIAPYREILL